MKKLALPFMAVLFAVLAFAPSLLDGYNLSLLGRFLALALVTLGLVWCWGKGGVLSLGQGVFFGLGGYALAMHLKLVGLPAGEIPDFMMWNGMTSLPAWWEPFKNPFFAVAMVFVVPGIASFIMANLLFRRRITGVYVSLITQAVALAFATLLTSQQGVTGGFNGLTNFSTLFGFNYGTPEMQKVLYWITLGFVALTFVVGVVLERTYFGKTLLAIRDGENRSRYLGYDPVPYKVFAFTLAGILAGVAGALFTLHVGVISPAMVGVVPSIEMVVWAAIGGRESLMGAIIGTVFINFAKDRISTALPDAWLYIMGVLFMLVVLFPPQSWKLPKIFRAAAKKPALKEVHGD